MRARNIKPGIFKNEILGTSDPLLTILFEGLWCLADRDGKLEDRPLRIKAEVFPYRSLDIHRYLTELSRLGFIQRYEVGKKCFIYIPEFKNHQRPHHTEKKSKLPDIPDRCDLTVNSRLNNGEYPPDSLIPDSLIPDCLIPDSLHGRTGAPNSPPPPEPPEPDHHNDNQMTLREISKLYTDSMPAVVVTPKVQRLLLQMTREHSREAIEDAFDRAARGNAKTVDYVFSILANGPRGDPRQDPTAEEYEAALTGGSRT